MSQGNGDAEGPDHGPPKRQNSTMLSAESQAVFSTLNKRSTRTGSGDTSSVLRFASFVDVIQELAADGDDANDGMAALLKTMIIEDAKLTKKNVRKLVSWFKEIEAAIGSRPSLEVMEKQFPLDDMMTPSIETHDNGAILVFGGIAMDMIGEVDHFPTPNSTLEASDFRTAPGGKGANEAVACGNLGTTVYVVGRVGNDDFGRTMVKRLAAYVNTDGIAVDEEVGTGFALIVTASDTQYKTNTICKGANGAVQEADLATAARILKERPEIYIMLLTLDAGDHRSSVISRAATLGQSANKLVILRASPLSESQGIVQDLWNNSNIIIVTETEAAIALAATDRSRRASTMTSSTAAPLRTLQQCAEAARAMLQRSKTVVAVIVSSAMGVSCRLNVGRMQKLHRNIMPPLADDVASDVDDPLEYTITLPCFRGPVVDVVGAVDALTGGIAAALSRGVPLSHALVWGTACCDRSISEHGAQDSMPSTDQLNGFFRMVNVRVATGPVADDPDVWPSVKPTIGATLRSLEELLHAGNQSEFVSEVSEMKALWSGTSQQLSVTLSEPVDFQGHSLLHLAVLYGDVESVLALLSHGASITARDNYGKTPLERCDIEYRAARNQARERFALLKFCLVCVDQVYRFRQGTSIPKSGDSLKLTLPLPPSSVESAQDGHSPPPSPRSTRSSAPDATLTCAEALTSLSEELAQLYDCGRNLSPLITDGWAHSLLSLMTLAMDEGMECEDYKTSLHELANSLLLEILADPTVRSMAIQQMATTSLRKSGTTFAHGLAHCGTDAVLRECQTESSEERTDVGGTADPRTTEETDVMPELEVRKLRGDEYVREHIQRSRCTDNQGWSLLHYATMGENLTMCGHLLTWGHDMYARDLQGSTPMAYCRNPAFAECIKKLQLVTDAFVSVGHTAQTDRVIAMLVEKAKDEQLKLWWDKGGQDDGPGIRPGEPWTAEIEKAMKKCKICIVILTKKWISSKYCKGEALCALSYNKQIITVLPPVPPEERAVISDIPSSMSTLKAALSQRQVVNLSKATDEAFIASLPELFRVIESIAPTFSQSLHADEEQLGQDYTTRISDIIMPHTSAFRWATQKHVFVLCGASAESKRGTAFGRLLAKQLIQSGVPVSLGFKPPDAVKDLQYADLLRTRIESCDFLVIVVEDTSDFDFLNSVAHQACSADTKVMVVPYNQMSESQAGFGYTAHLTSPATACFTDWMGTGIGLMDSSPVFQELFDDFLIKLDALHSETLSGVIRRRSSSMLQSSLSASMSSGFSIIGELDEEGTSPENLTDGTIRTGSFGQRSRVKKRSHSVGIT